MLECAVGWMSFVKFTVTDVDRPIIYEVNTASGLEPTYATNTFEVLFKSGLS